MNNLSPKQNPMSPKTPGHKFLMAIAIGCLLLALVGIFRSRREADHAQATSSRVPGTPASAETNFQDLREKLVARTPVRGAADSAALSPEQVVSNKLGQFVRHRRDILHAIARKHGIAVPVDVEQFFKAAEENRWEEMDALFKSMTERKKTEAGAQELAKLFPAILDAYGAAEQAHLWPAQQLLDYGKAVLGSLRPGMAYLGGTDAGRWIPALLTETDEGERHVVITQNALADQSYLEYTRFLYGDQMTMLTNEDSQRAFSEYLADAQRRLRHDMDFPEEPKQVRPGEDIRIQDNRVQVSGQVAVMAINEKLVQTWMRNNPDRTFALQESSALQGTYRAAAPLGPIMELGVADSAGSYTPERLAEAVDYWRTTARGLLADPQASGSTEALESFSKLATAQANLFSNRQFGTEAEQTYRLAAEIWPENVEAVGGLAALLIDSGREDEARQRIDAFGRAYPEKRSELERKQALWRFNVAHPN